MPRKPKGLRSAVPQAPFAVALVRLTCQSKSPLPWPNLRVNQRSQAHERVVKTTYARMINRVLRSYEVYNCAVCEVLAQANAATASFLLRCHTRTATLLLYLS